MSNLTNFSTKGVSHSATKFVSNSRTFKFIVDEHAGFQSIRILLTPESDATPEALLKWLETVEGRCPVRDNLANITLLEIGIKEHVAA